jgi:hypothetical protein
MIYMPVLCKARFTGHVVSRPLTAEARVRARASVCDGQSGTETSSSQTSSASFCQCHSTVALHARGRLTRCQLVAAVHRHILTQSTCTEQQLQKPLTDFDEI